MTDRYRMQVSKVSDDEFLHVEIFVEGRSGGWDADLKDYCAFRGSCTAERADAILAALNATAAPARLEAAE